MIRKYIVIILLTVLIAAIYWQVRDHDFVCLDDREYITGNSHVQDGLTLESLRWALTATYAFNWHPLTWLSHMADQQFFGPSPAGPHLMNVFLHILNTILLLVLMHRMTGGFWQSAFVAALFALHPLHVESVAWVAERKDVLSTLFFFLTILFYANYAKGSVIVWYLLSFFCFALGLMAKPMLVTLPFVLLLMDYWPLMRYDRLSSPGDARTSPQQPLRRLVLEKTPFILLAVLSSIITLIAQRGSMVTSDNLPMTVRIGNAVISYAGYLMKMIWPADLTVFYPLAWTYQPWKIAGAVALLITVSIWAIRSSGKRPYLLVGWLWYIGTLVPVIGIVQVGSQSMADRYTYIPLIGIFIMAAWSLSDAVSRWPRFRLAATVSTLLMLMILSGLTWVQIVYWKNELTLFSHSVAVTKNNYVALRTLGEILIRQERPAEALMYLRQASALNVAVNDAEIPHNIGIALSKLGENAEAAVYIQAAVRLKPSNASAYNDLGIILARSGDPTGAEKQFREAVRIEPDSPDFRIGLGLFLMNAGQLDEAIQQYAELLSKHPDNAKAHYSIGVALTRLGKKREAIKHFSEALDLNPTDENFRQSLEFARRSLHAVDKTVNH